MKDKQLMSVSNIACVRNIVTVSAIAWEWVTVQVYVGGSVLRMQKCLINYAMCSIKKYNSTS